MSYAIKGIYAGGIVDLIEKPNLPEPTEVLVIFMGNKKKIRKIGGLFREFEIDYGKMEEDLKELSCNSMRHILNEAGERE